MIGSRGWKFDVILSIQTSQGNIVAHEGELEFFCYGYIQYFFINLPVK